MTKKITNKKTKEVGSKLVLNLSKMIDFSLNDIEIILKFLRIQSDYSLILTEEETDPEIKFDNYMNYKNNNKMIDSLESIRILKVVKNDH